MDYLGINQCHIFTTYKRHEPEKWFQDSEYDNNYHFNKNDTVYLPTIKIKLNYDDITLNITNGMYHNLFFARYKLDELESFYNYKSSRFTRKKATLKYSNIDKLKNILIEIVPASIVIAFISLIMMSSLYTSFYNSMSGIQIIGILFSILFILPIICATILIIIGIIPMYMYEEYSDSFEKYFLIDIPMNNISNYYDETEYKIVSVETEISDTGVRIIADEIDAEWVYERKADNTLPTDAIDILEILKEEDNADILFTQYRPNYYDNLKCTNDKWWIDIDKSQ